MDVRISNPFVDFPQQLEAFLNSQAKPVQLQSRSNYTVRFPADGTQKVLIQAFAKEKSLSDAFVDLFIYLFIYFFVMFFLLNTAAWAPPCRKAQYGSVCKSESGGHKAENRVEPPGEI